MSFMFNPYPYDDPNPINKLDLPEESGTTLTTGLRPAAAALAKRIAGLCTGLNHGPVIGLDGYPAAEWLPLIRLTAQALRPMGIDSAVFDVESAYRSSEELENMLADNLPENLEDDPVLLFGKLFHDDISTLFDQDELERLAQKLATPAPAKAVRFVYGCGTGVRAIRRHLDMLLYVDLIPKEVILRIKNGEFCNLGDRRERSFKEILRRCYFFDFEICGRLRSELLEEGLVDYYIAGSSKRDLQMMPRETFDAVCRALVNRPFRCKPVYIEGVWGGYYTKKLRSLPEGMRNCAWVFDLIPLEVSVLVQIGGHVVDIPYFTFVKKEGTALMGKECVDAFGGYFPIRFNYDDTYHSNGNMSIQVHPTDDLIKEKFSEHGRQDESYYIVATGHGAKTYCGLKEGIDLDRFWQGIGRSETERVPLDYDSYVNSVPSFPGRQFLLPAGTIHCSGRNQMILEIGSLTIGSYTFKLYDYLRKDLDGVPRPIHSRYGRRVLQTHRQAGWVSENLVQEPRLTAEGDGWKEFIVGEHDLLYFSLRRLEFLSEAIQETGGKFHVLVLVDGEKVVVESLEDSSRCYTMNYLDMVVVPACLGAYRIRNLGDQPVSVHKTCLKDDFRESL